MHNGLSKFFKHPVMFCLCQESLTIRNKNMLDMTETNVINLFRIYI